jgi:short-subunit dehydrogenase
MGYTQEVAMSNKQKQLVVLVTGGSSGMGKETAIELAGRGHIVYTGARRVEKMQDLEPMGIIPLAMDVSKESENSASVKKIIDEQGRIDVLINNAGFGLYGPVEEIPLEDARYQFEVNLFGLASLTRLVLPHMRKQGAGRIINISSMGGKIYTPLGAWYHATKHAVEGFSDCLRLELAPFGIDVVVIEPGLIKTNFYGVFSKSLSKFTESDAYKSQVKPYIDLMNSPQMESMGTEASVLGRTIAHAATTKRPKTRYVKGQMAGLMLFIRKTFGDRVFDVFVRKAFKG